jgi:hypothetical protein
MHRAKQFLVHKLDLGSKRALCKPARVGYYTACRSLSMHFVPVPYLTLPLSLPCSISPPLPDPVLLHTSNNSTPPSVLVLVVNFAPLP